jgi:hypothetical protein
MDQKSGFLSKSFIFWIVANILGFSTAVAIPYLFMSQIQLIQSDFLAVIFMTVPISLAQWLVLRYISHISFLWILTFTAGFLIFALVYRLIPAEWMQTVGDESITLLTGEFIMIGFMIGLLQWLILRVQFSESLLWLLGSTAGVGFSFWLILAANLINQSGIISIVVGVLMYATITGLILIRLLTHPNQMVRLEVISP